MLESIRISLHGWMQFICDACHCLWRKFWISVSDLWNSAGIWVEAVDVQFCLTWISLYENGNRFVTDGIRCVFFLSHLLLYNYNIRKNWLYVTDNLAHSIANYISDWTIFFILLLQQLLTLLSVTCISTWFGNLSVKLRSQIQNLIKRWLGCSLHLPSRSKVSHRRLTTPTVCHL